MPHSVDACDPNCTISRSKGIDSVTLGGQGRYCVDAPGIDSVSTSAAVSIDAGLTNFPAGNATAMLVSSSPSCGAGEFQVNTVRQPSVAVRNSANTGSVNVSGSSDDVTGANDVSFAILIP